MAALLQLSRLIDRFSEFVGRWVAWLVLFAVLISAGNAISRKAFNLSSNAYLEIQWYLFAAIFMLAAGYTLLRQEHVKIDVVSGRLSKRAQIWIDIIGLSCFLLPFVVYIIQLSMPLVINAYVTSEMSSNAGGLIRWPVFALLPLGLLLLGIQAISELIKRVAFLKGMVPDPTRKGGDKTPEEELAEFLLQKEVAAREAAVLGGAQMIEFLTAYMAPIMFCALVVFLMFGYAVAFSLAACGLFFGIVGIELGVITPAFLQGLPLRIFGIMQNDTLLAIPFFTFMGLILERSGMAEDLLDTIGQLFGPVRGGLAYAVILVGAMLAATTGVVAASVISMGLISLPIMLRYGYDRRVASGAIAASGTLAQIIPPSLVLIVLADQLGRSVGDLYKGAFVPGFVLTGLYIGYILVVSLLRPHWVPALPREARTIREADGTPGLRSLGVLTAVSVLAAIGFAKLRPQGTPTDELIVTSMCVGVGVAFVAAVINKLARLGLLSKMAERVTFVLIPPLALIFLVLGTIFLGIATPTEGGAMGAVGALAMAVSRGRLSMKLLRQAMDSTMKLSCFVLFILIGATVFSLAFQGVDGPKWVEHLLTGLPGGQLGFLIVVNILIFVLAFFLDFFELAFIIIPLVAPVADKLGIDLVWFGVLIAVNMQTSFMHPPFGFALFYLRSVAPHDDYTDKVTGKPIKKVTIEQIYWGAVPFVIIQVVMVALIIAFPGLVSTADKGPQLDADKLLQQMESQPRGSSIDAATSGSAAASEAAGGAEASDDPMKGLLESMKREQNKKP